MILLRKLRREAGMTQQELCHETGVPLSVLRSFERGEALPADWVEIVIAEALDYDRHPDELFMDEKEVEEFIREEEMLAADEDDDAMDDDNELADCEEDF